MTRTRTLALLGLVLIVGAVSAVWLVSGSGDQLSSENGTTVQPPPPPPPPPPPVGLQGDIDSILEGLPLANVAFNAPTRARLDESTVIQLLLSARQSIRDLQEQLTEVGEREGARIKVSDLMEAHLTGLGFKIEAIRPERQLVTRRARTRWEWEVEPTETGSQRLHLTLSALIKVEGERAPRVIRTFDRTIVIRVSWSQKITDFVGDNWQWLWTAIFIPIVGWIWQRRRRADG